MIDWETFPESLAGPSADAHESSRIRTSFVGLTRVHLRLSAARLRFSFVGSYRILSCRRSTLPRSFFGKLSTNSIQRGYLWSARLDFTNCLISSASSSHGV